MHEVIKITDVLVLEAFNQLVTWTSQHLKSLWLGQGSLSNDNENEGVQKKHKCKIRWLQAGSAPKKIPKSKNISKNIKGRNSKMKDDIGLMAIG